MPIDVTCPKCNLILPAPDEFAGKRIRCADCNTIVDVPSPGASTVDLKPAPNFDRPPRRFLNDDDQRPRRREEPERASMAIPLIFAGVLAGSIAIAGAAFFVLGERKVEPPVEPIPAPRPIPIDPPKPAPPLPPFKPTVPEKKTPPKFPASPVGPSSIAGLRFHLPLDSKVGTATLDLHAAKYAGKIAETVEIVAGKRGKRSSSRWRVGPRLLRPRSPDST